jgi:hypothetical protein
MSDADDRFLEALAAELGPAFGPALRILEMDLDRLRRGRVRIRVRLDSPNGPYEFVEEGTSVTAVARRLMERAPVERLTDGFRSIIGQPRRPERHSGQAGPPGR